MSLILDRVFCPICGAAGGRLYAQVKHKIAPGGTASWVECPGCRLVYQPRLRRLSESVELDAGEARPYNPADKKIQDYEQRWDEKRGGFRKRLERLTEGVADGATVFEVGFGGGLLLRHLTECGRFGRIAGVEVASQYVRHATDCGYEAYWADVSDSVPEALQGAADAVVCNEVMEHVERPPDFVRGCLSMLKAGGIFRASFAIPDHRDRMSASEWQYWRVESIEALMKALGQPAGRYTVRASARVGYVRIERQ
ncbi:MAG TPA: methyltransferase domain-containing protein [Phycisphaerae bacterium]|nr:methyltransferase domain-containing protein [Phycisphaerae bacterium]